MSILTETRQGEYGYREHFSAEADSPLDLLESVPENAERQREISRQLHGVGYGADWYDRGLGYQPTGDQVTEFILKGHPAFLENLVPKIARLKPPYVQEAQFRQTKRRRKRVRGDFGNELDIHAVRQGRIDTAWTRTKHELREDHSNRNVHLIINCSLNAVISAQEAEWRTAAAVAVYDELVRLGKSVAIYMVRTSSNMFVGQSSTICTLMVPVKKLGTQISQYHVAAYCSASFTRAVMMYRYSNLIPGKTPVGNYGVAANVPVLSRSLRHARDNGQFVLYLPHAFSEHAARAAVEAVVGQVAGKVAA